MQGVGNGLALVLADAPSLGFIQVSGLALNLVQSCEQRQGLLPNCTLVVHPQLMELARCVRQAAGLGHALGE